MSYSDPDLEKVRKAVVALQENGASYREIGTKVGLSRTTINDFCMAKVTDPRWSVVKKLARYAGVEVNLNKKK